MASELVVRILGDASGLEREFRRSANGAKKFERQMGQTSRGALAASLSFRGLGRSIAFASAGFLGGFGLAAAVRSSFEELSKAQKVGAQTNAVIESTGGVAGVSAEHVQELADQLLNLTGVDDEVIKSGENMLLTFTNIRNVTGANNDIFDQATRAGLDMATALEGAGFEGGNLQTTMIRLGKALNDPVRGVTALRRVGVQFTKDQEKLIKRLVETGDVLGAQKLILREVTREFGGSAEAAGTTLSGKLGKLRENVRNVAADILTQLLPAITRIVDRLTAWVQNTENQRRILDASQQVIGAVTDAANVLRGAFEKLNAITGSTKNSLKILFGVLVAYKTLKLVGVLAGIASNVGLIGTNARTADGQVAGLRGSLGKLKGIGAIAVGITVAIAITQTPQYKEFRKFLEKGPGGGGRGGTGKSLSDALFGNFQENLKTVFSTDPDVSLPAAILHGIVDRFKKEGEKSVTTIEQTRQELGKAFGAVFSKVFELSGGLAQRPGVVPGAPQETKAQREARLARIRQSNEATRQLAQERAAFAVERATATKTLTDDLAALNAYNALLQRRIAGGHKTLALEREQFQVQQQIADVLKQQAEARKAQRDARQFKLLGFGPTGEDLVPGVKNLKRQLDSVRKTIEGSFLDTRKTRGLLGHIRQVLAGGLGSVSADVRSKIQQILADLKGQLKQSSVDVTRFQDTARGQFTLAGAHPGGGLVINGGIHLHGVQDVKALENQLAKRAKQRGHARRGNR
jgi:hypothetical protein